MNGCIQVHKILQVVQHAIQLESRSTNLEDSEQAWQLVARDVDEFEAFLKPSQLPETTRAQLLQFSHKMQTVIRNHVRFLQCLAQKSAPRRFREKKKRPSPCQAPNDAYAQPLIQTEPKELFRNLSWNEGGGFEVTSDKS